MFSHITVGSRDLERAGHFYDALLNPLGLVRRRGTPDGGPAVLCWAYLRDPDGNKIHIVHRADLLP